MNVYEKPREPYRRILITRLKYIGDIVLATPLIRAVRASYPDSQISFLGEKEAVSLLQNNPDLTSIIPLDFKKGIFSQLSLFRDLRSQRFDLVIDLFSNPRSALLSYATGAKTRIGLGGRSRSGLYTHRIEDEGGPKNVIESYFQFLRPLEIEPASHTTRIFLTEDERREARIYLHWLGIDVERPIVGLHPGASWPAKVWPSDRLAELADLIAAKLDAQVLITQGPKDHEIVADVSRKCVSNVKILDIVPLRQLSAILSHVIVYVANDSGPMHISVAVGTKTIGIFGPGEENIWFPYNQADGHLALRKDVWCHPCHLDFCDKVGDDYMKCMKLLEVREVFDAVKIRLEEAPAPQNR